MIITNGIETSGLHQKLALRVCMLIGSNPKWILLGLLFTNGFLSIWVSNAAVASMMMPITISIARQLVEMDPFYSTAAHSPRAVKGTLTIQSIGHFQYLTYERNNLLYISDISTIEMSDMNSTDQEANKSSGDRDDMAIFAPPKATKLLKGKRNIYSITRF